MTAQMKPVEDLELSPAYQSRRAPLWRRAIVLILKVLIPLAILAVAAKVAYALFLSSPVADRKARPRVPRLVEVIEVIPATQGPVIEAWGEVVAARTLVVRPEIGGTIVALSDRLTPGGLVLAGENLIRLDTREQRLAVAQAEAEMHQIEARIATENGQQERAKRDLDRLPGKLTETQRQLVLRAPQMAALQAELAAAGQWSEDTKTITFVIEAEVNKRLKAKKDADMAKARKQAIPTIRTTIAQWIAKVSGQSAEVAAVTAVKMVSGDETLKRGKYTVTISMLFSDVIDGAFAAHEKARKAAEAAAKKDLAPAATEKLPPGTNSGSAEEPGATNGKKP